MSKAKKYTMMDSTLCAWAIEEGWEDTRKSLDTLVDWGSLGKIPVGDLEPWWVGAEVVKNFSHKFLENLPAQVRPFMFRALDAVDPEVVGNYVITYAKGGNN